MCKFRYIFLAIYTAEMIIKSIAKGFILNKYTYLRNPWNWLDFVVITSGYATIGMEVGNLAGLRTFRVLRALKTISILPGLKTIINALLHSFKQLAEVMTLTVFCLMVFALFALQVYKGELRNKCVLKMEIHNASYEVWFNWTGDPSHWLLRNESGEPLLCGNVTGSRHCPKTHTCLCVGENPNHGYTSFDNFFWAMLTTFQLITLDYWENVYNMVLSSCGPISVSFFTVVVFFGSFYLINLMLAVVALSYEEEAEITQEERKKELVDHREDSTFSFDPASLNVRKLSKQKIKKIDARKGVLLSSYSRKKTRRRKRNRSTNNPGKYAGEASHISNGGKDVKSSPKRKSMEQTVSGTCAKSTGTVPTSSLSSMWMLQQSGLSLDTIGSYTIDAGGLGLQEIYYNIPGAHVDGEDEDVFQIALDKLNAYFAPKQSKVYERHLFRLIRQEENERFEKFLVRLRHQAAKCGFTNPDEHLIDRITEKGLSVELRKKKLSKGDEMNLEIIVSEDNALETVSRQIELFKNPSLEEKYNINAIRQNTEKNNWSKPRECTRCGGNDHTARDRHCPALNKDCLRCGYMGHFKQFCKSRYFKRRNVNKEENRRREDKKKKPNKPSDAEVDYVFHLDEDSSIECFIGGVSVNMLIDSGSSCNIINHNTWNSMKLSKATVFNQVKSPDKILMAYATNRPLEIVGSFEADLEISKKKHRSLFYVDSGGTKNLLGKRTAITMDVLRIGLQTVNAISTFPKFKNVLIDIPIDEKTNPICQPYRRIPIPLETKVNQKLSDLIDADIIEEVNEPSKWVSPMVPVMKEGGDLRICVDMRRANAAIVRENHPLPTMDQVLPQLHKSVTSSPNSSPTQIRSADMPQILALPIPPTKHTQVADSKCPAPGTYKLQPSNTNTLAPKRREMNSRQASSNSGGDGYNRESSLDDSGVVDDHETEGDATSEDVASHIPSAATTNTTRPFEGSSIRVTLSPKEIKLIKCNGVGSSKKKIDSLPQDYLSHIVVIDDQIMDRNCGGCAQCCIDYDGWLHFQQALYRIVRDPLFELTITVCIVLNTMFLAMEHHGMSANVLRALDVGNKVFTSIFTFECCLKLMALSKEFFYCGWNIFDLIIVSASLLDLIFELVDGLSVLRGLRLLRVLKLAQSWITMKVLLSIIISTIGALGNLTFVLVIVIYIFAVIGMQLFSKDYTRAKFDPDPVPRWNFTDFFHSFMMIFRILCGEWIEPLWDCMRAESSEGPGTCLAVFLPTLVMGNFMVLNLFLALLLNSFNSEELKTRKQEVGDESKLAQSFERIRDLVRKRRQQRLQEQQQHANHSRLEKIVQEVMQKHSEEIALKAGMANAIENPVFGFPRDKLSYQEAMNRPISIISYELPLECQTMQKGDSESKYYTEMDKRYSTAINGNSQESEGGAERVRLIQNRKVYVKLPQNLSSTQGATNVGKEDHTRTTESVEKKCINRSTSVDTQHDEESVLCPERNSAHLEGIQQRPWQALVSYVDELTVGGRRNSKGQYVDGMGGFPAFGNKKPPKVPPDCFPVKCYDKCTCLNRVVDTKIGHQWSQVRTLVLSVVDTPTFEWLILVLIFASSVTLCFEDIHLDESPDLKTILYWTNLVFSIIFIIEMFLKWIAHGFHKYFTSFWTLLDFLIVFVSLFSLLIEENENLRVLRSLRTLRALRPLRAISRWQGMRIVVNALMYAIPSIFNVLLVCLVFWLIFSIMGVQFFSGKFFKCLGEKGELLPIHIVNTKWDCHEKNFTWTNSKISFDHVGIAYLALFQVATFEGWMEVMADAVDARGVDLQPQREANLYAYIYFVIFIVCGSFFTLNLFIGVIIDNFNMLKKKYEGGVLEMFLTESQKHYYTAMKKLGRKKPQKVIKRPMNQFLAMFYDLSNSRRFEIAIFVLIFLNMLSMGIEHYDQPHAVFFILEVGNAFFTTVFGLEAIVKIIGLRHHYFTVPWNVFDFLLVLASILGILMEDIMIDFPVSPTLLRVVRVFRIGRILRLIKAAKGIRKLLFALVVSLPALFNIGALLALITFIYAIIGMFLFGHVKQQGALDDMVNFQTFGRSMHLLFRLITSAGWNDVLESLMVEPPECDPHYKDQSNGNCGYPLLSIIYFTSFIIINYMIVINMYIAIILENFNQAHQEEEIGIVEDDLEMFYIRWSKYDPHATQFIHFSQLSDFIASLDPPLGISKPNTVALVSFNLPIAKGNKIHCLDILHALVKHVLGHVEETDNFRQLQEQMDIKFKKQFPTRKELEIVSSTRIWKRQDKATRLIQKAFRDYIKRKRERERIQEEVDEMTQTSSPGGGWQGRLSAFLHVHRGSRASSRKSSRASEASDLSDLGGPWLNLPLLLLSNVDPEEMEMKRDATDAISIKIDEATPEATTPTCQPTTRRRSIYNFFLRHQDAVETAENSDYVSPKKKSQSLHPAMAEEMKPKRGSVIRRKRSGSLNTRPTSQISEPNSGTDVSILVTEASPEAPPSQPKPPPLIRQQSEATVVHVLVHRESEEYNNPGDEHTPTIQVTKDSNPNRSDNKFDS